jgi:hypothetical protein
MPESIGDAGTKAMAFTRSIMLSYRPQIKRLKDLEDFIQTLCPPAKPGEPLDVTTRARMEALFGYDLGAVRVHHGQQVEEVSHSLDARAFAFGNDVFIPRKSQEASTVEEQGLLAHELTHAIQQVHPQKLTQVNHEPKGVSPLLAETSPAPSASRSPPEMVLLATQGTTPGGNHQQSEVQAQTNEQLAAESLDNTTQRHRIDTKEVTDRVYRLIRNDLLLERERAIRIGGKPWYSR